MKKQILSVLLLTACLGCSKPAPVANTSASPAPPATATPTESIGLGAQQQADVQFPKTEYYPGEEITLTIMAVGLNDAGWAGVIPSDIEHGSEKINDDNDISYVHPNEKKHPFLVAPRKPGKYDVRLNSDDNDGKELASRSFTVVEDPNPVTEPKITVEGGLEVKAGASVNVQFEAPLTYETNAWVGWVPSTVAHGKESENDSNNLGYTFLQGRTRGTAVLTAPAEAGQYDLRLNDSDSDGKEVASITVTVK